MNTVRTSTKGKKNLRKCQKEVRELNNIVAEVKNTLEGLNNIQDETNKGSMNWKTGHQVRAEKKKTKNLSENRLRDL